MDLGNRFGRLVVVGHSKTNRRKVIVVCDCGTSKEVFSHGLSKGGKNSCGCWKSELSRQRLWKHGKTGTRLYRIYNGMITRCENKNCKAYPRYGGRGISICDEWRGENGFQNFQRDMGDIPEGNHSIERLDNDKGYSKENCTWSDSKHQARNRSTNHVLTIDGVSKCISEWAEVSPVKLGTIQFRVSFGWPHKQAVFKPARPIRPWKRHLK